LKYYILYRIDLDNITVTYIFYIKDNLKHENIPSYNLKMYHLKFASNLNNKIIKLVKTIFQFQTNVNNNQLANASQIIALIDFGG